MSATILKKQVPFAGINGVITGSDNFIFDEATGTLIVTNLTAGNLVFGGETTADFTTTGNTIIGSASDDTLTINATSSILSPATFGTSTKLLFRDSAISLSSQNDGHLDIDADISLDMNSPLVNIPSAGTIAGIGTGANGITLKNLKNSATSTLSGTAKDITIDIGGTPYYFSVYPTKA